MLTLDTVTYRYAGASRPSLEAVSIEIAAGEVVGLLGASGAGKTTACLVASGLAPRVIGGTLDGRLRLDGMDVSRSPMWEVAAVVSIGFEDPASQRSTVCDTVFEEVAFAAVNLGRPRHEVVAGTWEALERLGIAGLAARGPADLSGGQQQLVAVAAALARKPLGLVLDEPTAQLDAAGAGLVLDAVAEAARAGAAVLLVEQRTDELAGRCDRAVVLADGRVALAGPTPEVLADPRLPALGVAEPGPVRLRRLAREAGLDPALLPMGG